MTTIHAMIGEETEDNLAMLQMSELSSLFGAAKIRCKFPCELVSNLPSKRPSKIDLAMPQPILPPACLNCMTISFP